jgi:hypothetical protein
LSFNTSNFELQKSNIVAFSYDNSLNITNRLNYDHVELNNSKHSDGIKDFFLAPVQDHCITYNDRSIVLWRQIYSNSVEVLFEKIFPCSILCATDQSNKFFVLETGECRLNCYYFPLNLNKSLELDFLASGIHFNIDNDLLYVCSSLLKEIKVYDQNLNLITVFSLGIQVESIVILKNIAFASNSKSDSYWILNLNNFSIKSKINHKLSQFNRIGKYVFELAGNQTIYCYNSLGEIINELDIKKIPNYRFSFTKLIKIGNDELILLTNRQLCIKFKK